MRGEWFVDRQLKPGAVLFEWNRPFSLWGYSGSHSQLLFRSVKYDPEMDPDHYPENRDAGDDTPPADKWPRTRIDLLFKPVDALGLRRLSYPSLQVRVATEQAAEQILGRSPWRHGDERVLKLVGPDRVADHVVCLAVGYYEDDGEYWEPSTFASDLSDGRTPPWRRRVLGGGPDGEMTARYASVRELTAALDADPPSQPTGGKGRGLYVVMTHINHGDGEDSRPNAVAAFLTRQDAEQRIRELNQRRNAACTATPERWIDVVPIDL